MKKLMTLAIWIMTCFSMNAQQEIILTKYTYNSLFFNPAYAGSHGFGEGTLMLHYRNQWLGLDGAPTTLMLGGEVSMFDNSVGLGGFLTRESIGVETRIDAVINFAYRIYLGEGYLAGGIRAGWSNYKSNFSDIVNEDSGDPVYSGPDINYNLLSIGLGAYYNTDNYYFGVSVPSFEVIGSGAGSSYRVRHIYANAGMLTGDEDSVVQLEPSVLIKYQSAAPLQYTLGLNVWLTNTLAIGGHYRSEDAVALSVELRLADKFLVAGAYDFTLSDINNYTNGTLEFMVGYLFSTEREGDRIRNLRHGGRF